MNPHHRRWARASLIALWLGTAGVSLLGWQGASRELLTGTLLPPAWHGAAIVAGSAADAVLGLALWCWDRPWVYRACLALLALMTLVASVLQPAMWLHPLGPLSKNLPIAALLLILQDLTPRHE
ncbi:DoxX-like family protein [Mitsuaria sp. WAJ17]|uniref:DoxX-like family protein n=1 Tax=Mitsuaria sp. WAJ17 TaxID=2761452 RepID=UPI0016026D35|nr:DoxX-like family protein [Mitsuaria sp. WAJ17]MBB2487807.1 DoxX-like family protein [Mitsuaria sp. WAJ17]